MRIARAIADLRLDRSRRIALVPTMGALHEGHVSLMRRARQEADLVVVSLFVNPTQFGPGEDFSSYPRAEEQDAEMAMQAGVDVLFAPSVSEVYPRRTTTIQVKGVSARWEGEHRPGHFDGVATVVCKLINIVQPQLTYFGKKDLQQCAVILRMVEDLNIPTTLVFCETIREADGLAMSSRNRYLNPHERETAARISHVLHDLRSKMSSQKLAEDQTSAALLASTADLEAHGIRVQYLALVDSRSFEPLPIPESGASLIFAGYLGSTRLIDNVQIP